MNRPFKLPQRNRIIFSHINEFMLKEKLGSGGFSTVYKAFHKTSRKMYAIKVIDFSQLSLLDQVNIEKEIRAHKVMNHKNVVQLYDFFWIDNHVYLVMEYCMGGDLFGYIRDCSPLNHVEIQRIFKQTVDGVAHVHTKGFINRDIKPENILIDRHGNIKICDFGWSTHKNEDEYRKLNAGTIQYMAPENLTGDYQDFKSDIWSLGILLYELFNGIEPYPGKNSKDQLRLIYEGEITYYRRDMPISAVELIEKILQPDKELRPTIQDVYSSDYLRDYVEVQAKVIDKRSASKSSITVSIHCYDKPLHGNYERDAHSVSINSRSTSPDQSNSKKVSQQQSRTKTPSKNPVSQLPIKLNNSKVNLVSLRGLLNKDSNTKTKLAESTVEPYEVMPNDSMAHIGSNLSFELSKDHRDTLRHSVDMPDGPLSPRIKKKDCIVYQSISYNPQQKQKPNNLSTSLNKSLLSLNIKGGSRNISPIKKKAPSPMQQSKRDQSEPKSPSFKELKPNKSSNKTPRRFTPLLTKDKSNSKLTPNGLSATKTGTKKLSGKNPVNKTSMALPNQKSIVNKSINILKISPSPIRKPVKNSTVIEAKRRMNPLRQTINLKGGESSRFTESPKPSKKTLNVINSKNRSPMIMASMKVNAFVKKRVDTGTPRSNRLEPKISNKK